MLKKFLNITQLLLFFLISLSSVVTAQTNSVNINAVYDPTGPNVVVLSPLPTYVGTPTVLNWTAASNAAYYIVEASSDIGFTTIVDTTNTVALTANLSSIPEGVLIYYRITPVSPSATNGIASNIVTATRDTIAPVTQATSATQAGNNIIVNYNANDGTSGVQLVYLYYSYNNGPWINYGSDPNTGSFLFTLANTTGTYDFFTVGIDNAGNIETKASTAETSISFVYTTPPPTPSLTPTPSVTPTPSATTTLTSSPTITPTTTVTTTIPVTTTIIPTTTPPVQSNVTIYGIPNATLIIKVNGQEVFNTNIGSDGVFQGPVTIDTNAQSVEFIILNPQGNIVYKNTTTYRPNYMVIVPPQFDNYYIISSKNQSIVISGITTPNAEVTLYTNPNLQSTTNTQNGFTQWIKIKADANGRFSATLDPSKLIINNIRLYGTTTINGGTSADSSQVLINLTGILSTNPAKPSDSLDLGQIIQKISEKPPIELIGLPPETVKQVQDTSQVVFIAATTIEGLGLLTLIAKLLQSGLLVPFIILLKKSNRYGRVYDAVTKKGIAFATINLYNAETQAFLKSVISDMRGSYSILLPDEEKSYYLEIKHPEYRPVEYNEKKVNAANAFYSIYTGGIFKIASEINFMIPLSKVQKRSFDILGFFYYRIAHNASFLFHKMLLILLIVSGIYAFMTYNVLGIIFFLIYAALYFLPLSRKLITNKTYGQINEKENQNLTPSANTFIGIFKEGKQIADTIITDDTGKYKADLHKGEYRIEVNKGGYEIDSSSTTSDIEPPYAILYTVKRKSSGTDINIKKRDE